MVAAMSLHSHWSLLTSENTVRRQRSQSHVGLFPLQSRVVGIGHSAPGFLVGVHAYGDASLLRVVPRSPRLPDALPETPVSHLLQQLLLIGNGDLHFHLLYNGPGSSLPQPMPLKSSQTTVHGCAVNRAQPTTGP